MAEFEVGNRVITPNAEKGTIVKKQFGFEFVSYHIEMDSTHNVYSYRDYQLTKID